MEINIEKHENNYGIISIALKAADYQEEYNNQLKEYRKKANLKGFRPGQVPLGLIKRMFGKDLKGEVVTNTVNKKMFDFIDTEVDVLFVPIQKNAPLTVDEIDAQEDFDFQFEVCLVPTINYDMKSASVEGYKIVPSEEDVELVIGRIQENNPRTVQASEVAMNDFVKGMFVQVDGDFKEEATLPTKQIAEGQFGLFEGKKVGDVISFDINEVLPEDNQIKHLFTPEEDVLASITGKFELTIQEITREGTPEMDQEFFDTVVGAGKVANEDEFRAELRSQIAEANQDYANNVLANDLRTKIMSEVTVNLPEELIKKVMQVSREQKLTEEEVAEQLPKFMESAKWHAISSRFMKEGDIKIEEQEVEMQARVMTRDQFARMGLMSLPQEQIDMIIDSVMKGEEKSRIMSEARESLTSEKLNKYLLSQVTVVDKEVSLKEFEAIVAELNEKAEKLAAENAPKAVEETTEA